jgi:hypothetical protein
MRTIQMFIVRYCTTVYYVSPSIHQVLKPTVLLLLIVGIYVTGRVLKRNIEALSCNHCCSEKTLSTTYPECEFVALVIQHGQLMCHIDVCGLSGSTIFVHIIS